jgi:RecB family endonuclease NucS
VRYVGRARSTLEPGERILIIKADGSLLVHRPVGYEPVNWQPSGSIFHVRSSENGLEVHAVRQKPRENVKITFSNVIMVSALSLQDSGEFLLYASEEDMQKAILARPDLLEEGFRPISYEKKVEPGFVDVYGEDKDGNLVVVEIKRKTANKEAVLQLARYIEAIKSKSNRKMPGRILAKMNALVDTKIIRKLYEASRAGVRVDLLVRGICCLRPGVPEISENIRVMSILDRFLEHSRLYYFHNGGNPEIYSGSADWMPRNFNKRAEILYPIEDTELKTRIIDEILMTYLNDNVKARLMQPDGSYPKGTVNYLVNRRLQEMAEMAKEFQLP